MTSRSAPLTRMVLKTFRRLGTKWFRIRLSITVVVTYSGRNWLRADSWLRILPLLVDDDESTT